MQTPEESADRIDATVQRKLVDNIQLAQAMGAEVVKLIGTDIAAELRRVRARARRDAAHCGTEPPLPMASVAVRVGRRAADAQQ